MVFQVAKCSPGQRIVPAEEGQVAEFFANFEPESSGFRVVRVQPESPIQVCDGIEVGREGMLPFYSLGRGLASIFG